MMGNYQDSSIPGKMQFGSGWWYLDQKDGMEKQINTLSNIGLLSRFIGMLTDSRSFLSFPRHDYFRRILCNLIGRDVENGELPNRSEEHTSELQSLMRISYAVFCLKKKKRKHNSKRSSRNQLMIPII